MHILVFASFSFLVEKFENNKERPLLHFCLFGLDLVWRANENTSFTNQKTPIKIAQDMRKLCEGEYPALAGTPVRECVRAGAAGAQTRRSLGHQLLHPLILRLLVLMSESRRYEHPLILRPRALQNAPASADPNS